MSEMRMENVFLVLIVFLSSCVAEPTSESFIPPIPEVTVTEDNPFDLHTVQTQVFIPQETFPQIKISTRVVTPTPTHFDNSRNDVSPSGQYVAVLETEYELGNEKDEIQIIDRDEDIVQKVTFTWTGEGAPRPILRPHHWSPDSLHFYYYMFFTGEGYYPLFTSNSLFRINIETGEKEEVIDCQYRIAYAFSKGDELLAYICQGEFPPRIVLRDTQTGEEVRWTIPLESVHGYEIGQIRWSPDETKLVFFASDLQLTSAYLLDLDRGALRVLFQDKEMWLNGIYDWSTDDSILLWVEAQGSGCCYVTTWLEMDPLLGETIEVPKPTPLP